MSFSIIQSNIVGKKFNVSYTNYCANNLNCSRGVLKDTYLLGHPTFDRILKYMSEDVSTNFRLRVRPTVQYRIHTKHYLH